LMLGRANSVRCRARCRIVRNYSARAQAQAAVQEYLSPWEREIALANAANAKKKEVCPIFVLGKAGEIAMKLWSAVFEAEGAKGLARIQRELAVFASFTRINNNWKNLLHTPDAFFDLAYKTEKMKEHLQTLAASPLFVQLMSQILAEGEIFSLDQITADFEEINRAFRREVEVRLITAYPLEPSAIDFYKSTIALDFLDPADNMIFSHTVEATEVKDQSTKSSFTSGYKVYIKNKLFDFTHNSDKEAVEQKIANELKTRNNPRDKFNKKIAGVVPAPVVEKLWMKTAKQRESIAKDEEVEGWQKGVDELFLPIPNIAVKE